VLFDSDRGQVAAYRIAGARLYRSNLVFEHPDKKWAEVLSRPARFPPGRVPGGRRGGVRGSRSWP
jgi:hypothetical protein